MGDKYISIVTPSLNQGKFIKENIDSISSSVEHVIVDGKSKDSTLTILNSIKKPRFQFISENDSGQSNAINKGLATISGNFFNWLNSDDYLEAGAEEAIYDAFSRPEVNVYIGKSNIVMNGDIVRKSQGTDVYGGNLARTIGQARIDQPETWWRKSVIDEIGPLNESLHYTMDRDWWIKYLLRFGLKGVYKDDKVLANFRLHEDSKTVSQADAFNNERNAYFRSMADYYGLSNQVKFLSESFKAHRIPLTNMPDHVDIDLLAKAYSYFFLLLAEEAYANGNHLMTRKTLKAIDNDNLDQEGIAFCDKLKFRSAFPSSVIHVMRKLKS